MLQVTMIGSHIIVTHEGRVVYTRLNDRWKVHRPKTSLLEVQYTTECDCFEGERFSVAIVYEHAFEGEPPFTFEQLHKALLEAKAPLKSRVYTNKYGEEITEIA